MTRYITPIDDEPSTFEVAQSHPLKAWLASAESLVRTGVAVPFPPPRKPLTRPEAESGFSALRSLAALHSPHHTTALWSQVLAHWNPSWGHGQTPILQSNPRRLWWDQLADLGHAGQAHLFAAWLETPALHGPAAHVWPSGTVLSPWKDVKDHWAYSVLFQGLRGLRSETPALVKGCQDVLSRLDARMAQEEKGWDWPSHWRIFYRQEASLLVPSDHPMPIQRPLLSAVGSISDKVDWVNMRVLGAHRLSQLVRRKTQILQGTRMVMVPLVDHSEAHLQQVLTAIESFRPWLAQDHAVPGENGHLLHVEGIIHPFPRLKAAWENVRVDVAMGSASSLPVGRRANRL